MKENGLSKNYDEEVREREWKEFNEKKRLRLINSDFTIIASNCCGTMMYYDMGLPFLSPTINLNIGMKDFVRMVENLPWYMEQEIVEVKEKSSCPIGMLGDVRIGFIHYKTFEEAVQKWEERKKRINWDNLFIVGTEKCGCDLKTVKKFDQLPYKNKVIFTHIEYPQIASAYYIKGFEEEDEMGVLTNYKGTPLKRRYLDDFDYVSFLNGNGIQDVKGETKGWLEKSINLLKERFQ